MTAIRFLPRPSLAEHRLSADTDQEEENKHHSGTANIPFTFLPHAPGRSQEVAAHRVTPRPKKLTSRLPPNLFTRHCYRVKECVPRNGLFYLPLSHLIPRSSQRETAGGASQVVKGRRKNKRYRVTLTAIHRT